MPKKQISTILCNFFNGRAKKVKNKAEKVFEGTGASTWNTKGSKKVKNCLKQVFEGTRSTQKGAAPKAAAPLCVGG